MNHAGRGSQDFSARPRRGRASAASGPRSQPIITNARPAVPISVVSLAVTVIGRVRVPEVAGRPPDGQGLSHTGQPGLCPAPSPGQRRRHDHPDDRAGQCLDCAGELARLRQGHPQPRGISQPREILRRQRGQGRRQRRPHRGDRAQAGRLRGESLHRQGIDAVTGQDVFLGREIPEKRTRRDLRRWPG
jgi:hypothetical protein